MLYLSFAYRSLLKFDNSYWSHDLIEIMFEFVEFACISCMFPIRHPSSAYIRSGVRGLLHTHWAKIPALRSIVYNLSNGHAAYITAYLCNYIAISDPEYVRS